PLGALGLTKVVVKTKPKTPGLVTFSVTGKDASLTLAPGDLPLVGTVLIDTAGHCGSATFTGPETGCAFNRKQTAVTCKYSGSRDTAPPPPSLRTARPRP